MQKLIQCLMIALVMAIGSAAILGNSSKVTSSVKWNERVEVSWAAL